MDCDCNYDFWKFVSLTVFQSSFCNVWYNSWETYLFELKQRLAICKSFLWRISVKQTLKTRKDGLGVSGENLFFFTLTTVVIELTNVQHKWDGKVALSQSFSRPNCKHTFTIFLSLVLNIKTVFKVAAGGLVLTSAYQLLRRGCTYEQLLTAVNTCVLPAGARLLQITEGSVYLKVQAESLTALDHLWRLYKNGTLKKRLQALFVTDEMRDLAGGEQVEVTVTIDEDEYEKSRNELATVEAQGYTLTKYI